MADISLTRQYPSLPWIAPFAVFMILLAVGPSLPIPQPWESILRVGVLVAVMLTISKDVVLSLRVRHVVPSVPSSLHGAFLFAMLSIGVPNWSKPR